MVPGPELNPNSRAHWRKRHEAAKELRFVAGHMARLATNLGMCEDWRLVGDVVMDISVSWDGRRKEMDSDNLIAACKPARDGIADVLFGGDDSRMVVGNVTQRTRGKGVT